MKVPWISKEKIALKARDLLETFQAVAGYRVKPPIPVEDIIERSLGLRLLYEDLEKVFGSNDVLGATYIDSEPPISNRGLYVSTRGSSSIALRGDWFLPALTRWVTGSCTAGMWMWRGSVTRNMRPSCAGPGTLKNPLNGRPITLRLVCSCRKKRFERRFKRCVGQNHLLSTMSEVRLKVSIVLQNRLLSNGLSLRPPCVKQVDSRMSPNRPWSFDYRTLAY